MQEIDVREKEYDWILISWFPHFLFLELIKKKYL